MRKEHRIYTPLMIYIGALFGGIIAPSYFISFNFYVLNKKRELLITIISSLILLLLFFTIIPKFKINPLIINIIIILSSYIIVKKFQENHIKKLKNLKRHTSINIIIIIIISNIIPIIISKII